MSGQFGFFGAGGSYGADLNFRTLQLCVYRKWSIRTGLGLYGGGGIKASLGNGPDTQITGATTNFEEYGIDFGKGPAGKLELKGPDGYGSSGSDISGGLGPGVGLSAGADWGQRTNIKCWPNRCD